MEFKVGSEVYGFTVTRIRKDEKAGGYFIEMTHGRSGARLCYSKNKEEKREFCFGTKSNRIAVP